ncbi:MAG: aldo/keto reductase [Promethearchaeota archaeon]
MVKPLNNFTIQHLKELLEVATIVPAISQVEFSPFLYQKKLLEFCTSREIRLEAYSPLTRGRKLDHPILQEISNKYHESHVQILIRWGAQHGIVEIPKCGSKKTSN